VSVIVKSAPELLAGDAGLAQGLEAGIDATQAPLASQARVWVEVHPPPLAALGLGKGVVDGSLESGVEGWGRRRLRLAVLRLHAAQVLRT
jgi:hypothetical protein